MNQEKIGKFISNKRKQNQMTQQDLAEQLGVSDKTISNWENGRNMPDLSLFKPICEKLNITINELLSGEEVKEESYQQKLEENIINLALENKRKFKKKLKILFIVTIIIIFISFIVFILYNNIELNVRYEKRTMKCNFIDNKLIYEIKGTSVLNTKYIERTIGNEKILIFHSSINLYNKRHSNFEYGESFAKIINNEDIVFGYRLQLDIDKSKYQNIIVYYTNNSLNKLKNMSDEELKEELEKSPKMCSIN